ncbi:MAG: transporter substrate-binding domain-containing protein [Devosia sp.]
MKHLLAIAAVLIAGLVIGAPAQAQTVDEIIAKGKIRIGVNAGAPPFSIVDAAGATIGYDVDVSNLLAKYLGVEVVISPFNAASRIPALESDKVDVVVATLSPTPARAQAVMFTMPYCTFQIVILGPKSSTVADFAGLSGVKVGLTRGTPQEASVVAGAPADAILTRFDDDSTTMQALIAGQVDVIAIPETVYSELKKVRPELEFEQKFVLYNQFMSIAVRQDAYELRQWLNTTLSFIKNNGELDAIAVKWTGKKLPTTMPVF